jgi:hypothetical protein
VSCRLLSLVSNSEAHLRYRAEAYLCGFVPVQKPPLELLRGKQPVQSQRPKERGRIVTKGPGGGTSGGITIRPFQRAKPRARLKRRDMKDVSGKRVDDYLTREEW